MQVKWVFGLSALALSVVLSPTPLWAGTAPMPVIQPRVSAPTLVNGPSLVFNAVKAQLGYPVYQDGLGSACLSGMSVIHNDELALGWLKRAADQGDDFAENWLGLLYSGKDGIPPDYATAAVWFRKASDNGLGYSQYRLGVLYEQGLGVPQNDVEAYKWYVLATLSGSKGTFYEELTMTARDQIVRRMTAGQIAAANASVKKWKPLPPSLAQLITDADQTDNGRQARRILAPLAADGQPMAQYMLGLLYEEGKGVAKNDAVAAGWYRKAAEQGHAGAQSRLAAMYMNAQGMPRDDAAAVAWLQKAADQGLGESQMVLGTMYAQGRGVAQDDTAAAVWLRKGADRGDGPAQLALAKLYHDGRGVPANDVQAYIWSRLAIYYSRSTELDNEAKAFAGQVAVSLTPEQTRLADDLVEAWLPVLPRP